MDLFYRLRSGKNNKLLYFVNSYAHEALWHGFYRSWRSILREARRRNDFAAIMSRELLLQSSGSAARQHARCEGLWQA